MTGSLINDSDQGLAPSSRSRWLPYDSALSGILAGDLFGSVAATIIQLIMVFWVLAQDVSGSVYTLMVLCIFVPLNVGVLLSGLAVGKFGARRLLVFSKSIAFLGALACWILLATGNMTLLSLALIATITYCSMGPSVSSDVSRVPALARRINYPLERFNAVNTIVMILGHMAGLMVAGYFGGEGPNASYALGIGVALVAISTVITWLTFPRDRIKKGRVSFAAREWAELSGGVLSHLGAAKIGMLVLVATAAIIAISEGFSEVVTPLAMRAADLPEMNLSIAYGCAVAASVVAALIAQAVYKSYSLTTILIFVALALSLSLLLNVFVGSWYQIVFTGALAAAAANGVGTVTFTAMQENVPQSLQAQAGSLWQSFILLSSSAIILLTGLVGDWSVLFLTLIGFSALVLGGWAVRNR